MARPRTTPIRLVGWLTMLAGVVFAALSVVARPATADPATAVVNGRAGGWKSIQLAGMGGLVDAGPVSLTINGTGYAGYCIDFHNGIDLSQALTYEERTWGAGSFPSELALQKVNWILHNSYPNVSAAAIAAAAGVDPATPELENIVGAATQAAIWYFSDGINLGPDELTTEVGLVHAYLTGPANVGIGETPPADVSIDPTDATGVAGGLIGPFKIASSAGTVDLSSDNPSVGFVVNGVAQATANDGDEVFAAVAGGTPPGSATITASASALVPSGRIFVNQAAPNSTQKLILAAAANNTYSDTATVNWTGGASPDASAVKDCAAGGFQVTLTNSGTADAQFVITNNGTAVGDPITVKAGETLTRLVPITKGSAYDLVVTSGTWSKSLGAGTFDCDEPVPDSDAAPDCAQGGVVVTLTNSGTAEATFSVTNKGVVIDGAVKVAAGASTTVLVPVTNGETYEIVVTSGTWSEHFDGTLTCGEAKPQVLFNTKCAAGGIETVLSNKDGTAAVTFTVTNNGTKVADVPVAAGEEKTQLVTVAEDAAYDIVVTVGAVQVGSSKGVLNCFSSEPSAEVTTNCVTGATGMLVTLRNKGNEDVTYTVANNGTNIATDVVVKAGGTNTVLVPMADGAAYSIVATPSKGTAQTFDGTFRCSVPSTTVPYSNPGAAVVDSCTDNAVVVNVSNTGSVAATFVIVSGGAKVGEVTNLIGSDRVVVPIGEGAGYTIRVTATGGFDRTFTGTRAPCTTTLASTTVPDGSTTTTDPEVLGTVVSTPTGPVQTIIPANEGSLPRTGGSTTSFLIIAMVLLGLGGGLLVIQDVLGGRQRRSS